MDAEATDGAFSLRVPLCGLPCSEMMIAPGPAGGTTVSGGCAAGRAAASLPIDGGATPAIEGRPASEGQAIAAAAALLLESRSPFAFGLSQSSCGTARRAAAICRLLRGAIDVEGAVAVENDLLSLRTFGLASATFGEVGRRSDVVLLWRCDPRNDHPDLLPPRLPGEGSAGRLFILAPPAGEAAHAAAQRLPVAEGGDLDALLALRAFTTGRASGARESDAALRRAALALRGARHAAIVWDATATGGPAGTAVAAALALLARDLNAHGRAAARPLGAGGNVAGAMASILSECGLARAVVFRRGGAREAPETFGAAPMLGGGADALLLIGAVAARPAPSGHLRRRAVVIGPRRPEGCDDPGVFIPTAVPAFSEKGLWLRADGVPVRMPAPLPSPRPTESEVLDRLIARLAAASGQPGRVAARRRGTSGDGGGNGA